MFILKLIRYAIEMLIVLFLIIYADHQVSTNHQILWVISQRNMVRTRYFK